MMRWIQCCLFAVIIYSSALSAEDSSSATNTPSPAEATVIVADRSQDARERGLRSAFSQVMIQLSNDPAVMMNPEVKNATAHLMQWVDSYAYDESHTHGEKPTLLLQVTFDRTALEQLIKRAPVATTALQNTLSQSSLLISVANVQSASDYAKVIQAFQDNAAVEAVSVKEVDATHVLLLLKIAGNTEQFKHALSEKHALQPTIAEFQRNNAIADLYYDWTENQV